MNLIWTFPRQMCHKETKALISLRTGVHVPLLTPWEAGAHTKTSLSNTSFSSETVQLSSFSPSVGGTQAERKRSRGRANEQKYSHVVSGCSFFSCHWWRAMFVFQSPWKKNPSHTRAGFYIWGSIYTDRISDYFYTLCGTNLMFSGLTTPKRKHQGVWLFSLHSHE